uniref:ER lumen protein retaining receptor n=1 Tax=Eimeria tenella TaxID=5802 RepID=H9B995_EIMTE|nr:hypothetical protein [Eimeria tenella]
MERVRDAARLVKNREKLMQWLSAHQTSVQAWAGLFVCGFLVYHLFSDGDFSFLLTVSSLVSTFSFLMVCFKMEKSKSARGVSLKLFESYLLLTFARLCSIVPYEGYLPYDRSGNWVYQTLEGLSLLLSGFIVYSIRFRFAASYDAAADNFPVFFLFAAALLLALLFHPSLNAFFPADVAWTFALYLESVAVLPQLFLFQKQGKVEPFTSHFLAAQALSQAISFIFWVSSYSELNGPQNSIRSYVGLWVIVVEFIQLVLMGDFIYHYIRCVSRGLPVQFLLSENV